MSKKNQCISLRLSDDERSHLEALKGSYSMSYVIRQLIREKPLNRFKMRPEANKNLPLELQEKHLSRWIESLT